MTINMQLHLTFYVTIALSLVTITALIGAANAVPQDVLTNSPKIVDTAHLMYESVAAIVGSNPLTLSHNNPWGYTVIIDKHRTNLTTTAG
jgi:hypothetical protein